MPRSVSISPSVEPLEGEEPQAQLDVGSVSASSSVGRPLPPLPSISPSPADREEVAMSKAALVLTSPFKQGAPRDSKMTSTRVLGDITNLPDAGFSGQQHASASVTALKQDDIADQLEKLQRRANEVERVDAESDAARAIFEKQSKQMLAKLDQVLSLGSTSLEQS